MTDITKLMDEMLNQIDKERWISFSKDDSAETFKARDKLRAFGLIEKYNEHSWRLTSEGYKAIELGGVDQWHTRKGQMNEPRIQVHNLSIVTGNRNNVNQSNQENSPKARLTQEINQDRETQSSWIEIFSWIVGITAGLVAIYQFLLKDILAN